MGALTLAAALTALGVGWAGYRGDPKPPQGPVALMTGQVEGSGDPMSPRLFDSTEPIRIHVAGAVRKPGVYSLPAWARVTDAVKKAGGAAPNADLDAINLADRLVDGEQLRVPVKGRRERLALHRPTAAPEAPAPEVGGRGVGRYPFAAAAESGPAPKQPVNLNTADREQLESLPGVGPSTAERIMAYREARGPFLRLEDLLNVPGIGPAKLDRIREHVTLQ
jgi:competence protein ComEA